MIQNSTILEESQQYWNNAANDYVTFGNQATSPLKGFEDELEHNLDGLGTNRNTKNNRQTCRQPRSIRNPKYAQQIVFTQDEVSKFINQCFGKQTQVRFDHFSKQSLNFFIPKQKYNEKQFNFVASKLKKILTTSNPEFISLNALRVLNQQKPFKILLLQIYLEGKYKLKHKELDSQNNKILEQLRSLQNDINSEQQSLTRKHKQIEKKEVNLQIKEKQLLSKQKDLKGIISKEYERLESKLSKIYTDKAQDLDKKSSNIERGLKYKIQILDKKIEQLNTLKNAEKMSVQKYKEKIGKLEKQNAAMKTKQKEVEYNYQQFLNQQQQYLKKCKMFEDKVAKYEKKNSSLKEQIKAKENQIATLQQLLVVKQQQSKIEAKQNQEEKQIQPIKKSKVSHKNQQKTIASFISFTSLFLNTIQTSSLQLINSFISDTGRHLSLSQILFPKAQSLIKSFYCFYFQLFCQFPSAAIQSSSIHIVSCITSLILFCHKYTRIQKSQNILDKVFQNNKLKNSDKKQTQFYIINDDLSSKIINHVQKMLKKCQFEETLMMGLFSFISSSTIINRSASLVIVNEIIVDSFQLKQKLVELQFIPLFLDKINKKQPQQLDPFIDILLELTREQQLRSKLFEGIYCTQTYRDLWDILPIVPDKTSIVLQRFYYIHQDLGLQSHQAAVLRNVKKQWSKDVLTLTNLQAIESYFK